MLPFHPTSAPASICIRRFPRFSHRNFDSRSVAAVAVVVGPDCNSNRREFLCNSSSVTFDGKICVWRRILWQQRICYAKRFSCSIKRLLSPLHRFTHQTFMSRQRTRMIKTCWSENVNSFPFDSLFTPDFHSSQRNWMIFHLSSDFPTERHKPNVWVNAGPWKFPNFHSIKIISSGEACKFLIWF